MKKIFKKFLICIALIGFSFGIANADLKDTITPKLTKISKLSNITKVPAIQSINRVSKIFSIDSFNTYSTQPIITFNSYNITYGIPMISSYFVIQNPYSIESISSYFVIQNPYSIESIIYSGISKTFDKEQIVLTDIINIYNFEKQVLDITGIFYGQIENYIPRQSFEWDLLQKAKQDEFEFGLTKQVQEDYLYIYNSVIEDIKRNYNIDPDIKKYLKNQK